MKSHRFLALVVALVVAASPALPAEVLVVRDVLGAEGPLYVDGNLYFVGWISNTLSKWNGRKTTVLNDTPGCGHNGLALTKHRTFMLACTNDPGAILELDMHGRQLRRWDVDSTGAKLVGGINDVVASANDGVYATVFGPFVGQPSAVIGRILYLAPGNYANGIGLAPDQKTLYVSEMVGNTILKFHVNDDGTLSQRQNFALLSLLVPNKVNSWWIGPDSMKIDSKGNIYVAQWSGGKVLKLSPEGKLLHVFDITAGDGTTNVAFGPGEKELYVTVVQNPDDPQAKGAVVRIPNVP
jgi:gluconolactonase